MVVFACVPEISPSIRYSGLENIPGLVVYHSLVEITSGDSADTVKVDQETIDLSGNDTHIIDVQITFLTNTLL